MYSRILNFILKCKSSLSEINKLIINKPFEGCIREQFEKHLMTIWSCMVKITADSARRVLTAKLVANAWATMRENTGVIIRLFLKCDMSNNWDGSEYHLVNICGLESFEMKMNFILGMIMKIAVVKIAWKKGKLKAAPHQMRSLSATVNFDMYL